MSKPELKEDKMLEVQFVGDDDVLNHILDREGGTAWLYDLRDAYVVIMNYVTFYSILIFYFENIAHSISSGKIVNKNLIFSSLHSNFIENNKASSNMK